MRLLILLLLCTLTTACVSFHPERLDYAAVQPANKTSAMEYAVYTPPDWQPGERLPLIVFLHGGGGSHLSFERYGADTFLDAEIRAGRVARAIIVLPNGDNGFWENWADGSRHYRDWVLNDVMPQVQSAYQTLACPQDCHLAGISMGGYGALRFAVFAADRFSSVSAISAPIFNKQQAEKFKPSLLIRLLIPFKRIFGESYSQDFIRTNPVNAFVSNPDLRKIRLQLIRGSDDGSRIIDSNEQFHKRLTNENVPHQYLIYTGGHKWKYWVPELGVVVNYLTGFESGL